MRALIDGDPLVYIVGFGHDEMPLWYQCQQMDEFVESIIEETGSHTYSIYLTGKGNFRDEVATILPYKGNRDSSRRPRKYKELRKYLQEVWGARLITGIEADDACVIHAYHLLQKGKDYVVCSIDKDLLMLEGQHYNYKRREFETISEEEGWKRFYTQTLTGDNSDNIPGLYKVTGHKATKAIKEGLLTLTLPEEMDAYCLNTYEEMAETPAIQQYREIQELLWILRRPRTSPMFISEV